MNSQRNLQAHLKTAPISTQPKFLKELTKPTKERISFFFSNALKIKTPATQADKKQNDNDCKTTGGQGFNSKKRKYASSQHWLYNMAVYSQFRHFSSQ